MSISVADLESRIEPRNFRGRYPDLLGYVTILYNNVNQTLGEVWRHKQKEIALFDERLEKLTLPQRQLLYGQIKRMSEVVGAPNDKHYYKLAEFFFRNYLSIKN